MPDWFFPPLPAIGGATSDAWLNLMTATKFESEELIVREALQNCCDALQPDQQQARVRFERKILEAGETKEYKDFLKLEELTKTPHWAKLNLSEGNTLQKISEGKIGAEILLIEDFNTVGLSGRLVGAPSNEDHFCKLILMLGSSDKIGGNDTSGGSYGFGKTVYSSRSDCGTVVYYSSFPEDKRSGGHTARLIVSSMFRSHVLNDRQYDGRAFFGEIGGEGIDKMAYPIFNEDAHEVASRLGFQTRADGDFGTSIGILGCPVDMRLIRKAIETHWWPKLVEAELAIELIDDGEKMETPSPRSRDDLRNFLRAYEFVQQRNNPDKDRLEKVLSLDPEQGKQLGRLGLVGLPATDEPNDGFDNTVALIRGPKMVVHYHHCGTDALYRAVGTFKADDGVDSILRLSEPIEHNHWSKKSTRLPSELEQSIVDRILRRVKSNFRAFQNEISPDQPVSHGGLKAIEKLLAGMLPTKRPSSPDRPPTQKDPFEIRSSVSRRINDSVVCLEGKITLRLRDDAEAENLNVRVTLEANILENESLNKGDPIAIQIINQDGDIASIDSKKPFPVIQCRLTKDANVTLNVKTASVDPDWAVQFAERVEEIQELENS